MPIRLTVSLFLLIVATTHLSECLSIPTENSHGINKRQAASSVPVCTGGFAFDQSSTLQCQKDASGVQRQASELDCVFPFVYNGQWYETCIQNDKQFYWCSVDKVYANRFVRCETQCPLLTRKLMQKSPGATHSSCLPPSSSSGALYPGANEIQMILNAHNLIRSQVNPPAADMTIVSWDDSLARIAQRWAQNCAFGHDCETCRILPNNQALTVGQNAYASTNAPYDANFWNTVIQAWGKEIENYVYGAGSKTGNWLNVGHYTQIINAKSFKVGCGLSKCGASDLYAYCNYAVAQSDVNRPYTSGAACSSCPSGVCSNNLCMCNKLCQNYGELDKANCRCNCKPYATGDECETLLCDKSDQQYGCWGNDPNYCRYANTVGNCPKMCGICSH